MYQMRGEFLLPCPLCANPGTAVTKGRLRGAHQFIVYCGLCAAYVDRIVIGHVNKTRLRRCAVNAWNHRAIVGKRKNKLGLLACPLCGGFDIEWPRDNQIDCRCGFCINNAVVGGSEWDQVFEPHERWNRRDVKVPLHMRYGIPPPREN